MKRLLTISILILSLAPLACSKAGIAQDKKSITGTYVTDLSQKKVQHEVTLLLTAIDSTHGTYKIKGIGSEGKYEIKGDKMLLSEKVYRKEEYKLSMTGTLKDGDIYLETADALNPIKRLVKQSDSTDTSEPPRNPPPSIDNEAISEIRKKYETIYTKCGDSYYIRIGVGNYTVYTQLKDVSFSAQPRALTDTDQMNGVQWAGGVSVVSKFTRQSFAQGGGQHWGEWGHQLEPKKFTARNIKGQWQLDDAFSTIARTYTKPTCAEIPKD